MAKLSDETLVAFVDGELDAERVAEVEAALAQDEETRRTVQSFRESAAAVERAFDAPMYQKVPGALLQAIGATGERSDDVVDLASRREPQERTRKWRVSLPLAASIALAIGLGGGFQLSTVIDRGQSGSGDGPVLADANVDDGVLGRVLETTASGVSVAWRNSVTGGQGDITPVSTFKDKRGRYCREYGQTEKSAGNNRFAFGIACRNAAERWQMEVFVADALVAPPSAAAGAGDTFAPAAGNDTGLVDTLLESLMAGAPLTAEQEEALIGGKWR